MFKFFQLRRAERMHAAKPKDLHAWITHGLSEFFGTFILSWGLAGLSTVVNGSGEAVEKFFIHPVIIGFYAGFLVVGTCLVLFLRWSCDLNPAVTLYRILNGTNKVSYGLYKIGIQFVSGIFVGVLIYFAGHAHDATMANHAINPFKSAEDIIVVNTDSPWAGGAIIFVGEMVVTSLLLWPIFSKNFPDKYRDVLICLVISMAVWMGILQGSAALNPARGLAQQVPGLFWGSTQGGVATMGQLGISTVCMELGCLLAPVFLILMQGINEQYFNPWVSAMVKFKNYRSLNLRSDSQTREIEKWTKNKDKTDKNA